MTHPASIMTEIFNLVQTIQHSSMRLLGGSQFFGSGPSLPIPKFTYAELDMLRTLAWLYALYQELGKPSIIYIVDKFDVYGVDEGKNHRNHPVNVRNLRTIFQHNLDPLSQSDNKTRKDCEIWFKSQCNKVYPDTDDEWQQALIGLLEEAQGFLKSVLTCIRKIEEDESVEEMVRQWEFRLRRHHPQHEFDRIISIVAQDLGRVAIKPKNFSNQYYSQWVKELDLREDYDFEVEARRMIERAMIEDTRPRLPIDGQDVMNEFSLEPGKKVGDILKRAMQIFDRQPCSRDELLKKLEHELQID